MRWNRGSRSASSGNVLGHRVVEAADRAFVDRDPHERGQERLRHRERGLQRPPIGAAEVALVDEPVVLHDHERGRVGPPQEPVEIRASPAGAGRSSSAPAGSGLDPRRRDRARETGTGRPRRPPPRSSPARSTIGPSTTMPIRTGSAPPRRSRPRRRRCGAASGGAGESAVVRSTSRPLRERSGPTGRSRIDCSARSPATSARGPTMETHWIHQPVVPMGSFGGCQAKLLGWRGPPLVEPPKTGRTREELATLPSRFPETEEAHMAQWPKTVRGNLIAFARPDRPAGSGPVRDRAVGSIRVGFARRRHPGIRRSHHSEPSGRGRARPGPGRCPFVRRRPRHRRRHDDLEIPAR